MVAAKGKGYSSDSMTPMPTPPPLTPDLIVHAYCQGIFPMADDDGTVGWYSPDPRAIIPLDDRFHVPRSLRKAVRRAPYEIRFDTAFEAVMRGCADRAETWISEGIIAAYTALHRHGLAHSVEAWQDGQLVGGLYGVSLGGAFMGESMFAHAPDASKICVVHLVERLRARGYVLLDSQMHTDHMARFGLLLIPRSEYLLRLEQALHLARHFAD